MTEPAQPPSPASTEPSEDPTRSLAAGPDAPSETPVDQGSERVELGPASVIDAEFAAGPGPAEVAPPVVVVMVTHDPGTWFEETLAGLAAQDYGNASVLVVDTASEVVPEERIEAVLPEAHLRRLDTNPGFGAACNQALTAVQGAAFYLFCHDDAVLAPAAIRHLVEEAFRSNAGIVGPKLLDWHDPSRILAVGMGADKTGFPASYVDQGELDQAQHDSVRDVFYIPGAVTLVRADLFEALGGFDEGITFHGDDLDLCWRAHVVGARVIVAPAAEVRHLEALGERRPVDDRRRLQMRHRQRAAKVSYTRMSRWRVMPQAAFLALLEILYCLLIGRFRQIRDVEQAWTWNWTHRGDLSRRRKALKEIRTVSDREVRHLQVNGSRRLSAFLRGQIGSSEDRLLSLGETRKGVAATLRSSKARTSLVAWSIVVAVMLIGSRELLLHPIPAVGDFPVFGKSAVGLLREWVSGYRDVGLGSISPNPTGIGFLGFAGVILFGAMDLLRKVLILGMLPLGALGIWRLVKPIGSRRSRIVGLVVYVSIPVAYNAIAGGRWGGLVLYGLTPWILSQLAHASRIAPFGSLGGEAGPGVRERPLVQRIVAVGVLTALAAMLFPVSIAMVPLIAVALVLGGLLAGQAAGALRVLGVAFGGALVALVLQLPWSLSFMSTDWAALAGTSSVGGRQLELSEVLRFQTGPWGAAPLGFAFLLTGALALFIGRQWRLSWAVRSWVLLLGGLAGVWVSARGWLPGDLPAPELLAAPAAAGLALAAAMGMAAFEVDLPDYHFGWRQILSILAGAALVVGVLPVVSAMVDGRWELPRGDYNRTLAFLTKESDEVPQRVLWLGDADVLPLAGWRLDAPSIDDLGRGSTLVYATTDHGTPDVTDRWAGSPSEATDQLGDVLRLAAEDGTSRLGALLAPMGVRYIVVPLGPAPAPYTNEPRMPADLLTLLAGQLDLSAVDVNIGVVVYRNDAFGPSRALLPAGTEIPPGGPDIAGRFFPAVQGAPAAVPDKDHYAHFNGTIDDPSEVYLAAASSDHWKLRVGGVDAPRDEAMGWANSFAVDTTGDATLWFDTPGTRYLALGMQLFLWLVAIVYLLRVRVVTDERRTLDVSTAREGGST